MQHPIIERSSRTSAPSRRRRASRFALMGAAAALAFGSAVVAPVGPAFAEAPAVAAAGPASFADVVDRVKGAVVAIKVKAYEESHNPFEGQEISPDDPMYRFFKRFGGETPQRRMTQSQGSGFIISADGYVVTNNHVVEHASDVEVALDDGRTLPAKVIGTDKRTDLALLKVSDGKLPYVDWASTPPRVGDWVIAVGNPFGLGGSVTAGIVSARGRDIGAGPYDDFLQIDAPVNRGNSGGPAFDAHGNVVGVNTAIYSPSGGSVGIGFAIPAEVAKDVIASLKDKGVVARGWIGVKIQPVTPEIADSLGLKSTKGALIAQPQRGAPAEAAGLKAGDVIVAVNGDKVETPRDLARRIAAMGPNKTVDLTYIRNGSEESAKLTLGKLPEEKEARVDEEDMGGGAAGGAQVAGLGIEVAPASEVRGAGGQGLYVTDIDPEGAAAQKGLRRGDVIVEAGGQTVNSRADLSSAIDGARKDGRRSVLLRVKSADGSKFIAVPVKQSAG
ncbi:MAG: Do family serine endopeptidase [Methylocystis sp.]|uniref:Do family serine endopeptidase n=1 Tax=Methylocystis sp. TaxID=1911079 RepID=UPI003DA60260